MIVSDVAGTTRDSVDVRFARDGQDYVFVDTAGVRRRTRITDIVEKYSVNAALKSTTKADVTLLTLDATEGVSQQDKRLMDLLDTRKDPLHGAGQQMRPGARRPAQAAAAERERDVGLLQACAHPHGLGPQGHGPEQDPAPGPQDP